MEDRLMENVVRASRPLKVSVIHVTKKHPLYPYAEDGCVYAFRFRGRWYAMGQFVSRWSMWGFDMECKMYPKFICAYDVDGDLFHPYMMEMLDEETVRLWQDST